MKEKGYDPVSCDWHDELEAAALHKKEVVLELAEGNDRKSERGRVADVFTRDGAEFVRIENGDGSAEIRLDRIQAMRDAG